MLASMVNSEHQVSTSLETKTLSGFPHVTVRENSGELVGKYGYHPIQPSGFIDPDTISGELLGKLGFYYAHDMEYWASSANVCNILQSSLPDDMSLYEIPDSHVKTLKRLVDYTNESYMELNDFYGQGDNVSTSKETIIRAIDSTLREHSRNLYRMLFRGVTSRHPMFASYGGNIEKWVGENIKVGGFYEHPGLMSTTLWPEMAKSYAGVGTSKGDSLVFEIMSPNGVCVESITEHKYEYEVLLPSNPRFMILGVYETFSIAPGREHEKVFVIQMIEVGSEGKIA